MAPQQRSLEACHLLKVPNALLSAFFERRRMPLALASSYVDKFTIARAELARRSLTPQLEAPGKTASSSHSTPSSEVFISAMTVQAAAQPGPALQPALESRPTVHQQSPRTRRRGRIDDRSSVVALSVQGSCPETKCRHFSATLGSFSEDDRECRGWLPLEADRSSIVVPRRFLPGVDACPTRRPRHAPNEVACQVSAGLRPTLE